MYSYYERFVKRSKLF